LNCLERPEPPELRLLPSPGYCCFTRGQLFLWAMKPVISALFPVMLFVSSNLFGQTNPSPIPKPPQDTFALNILSAVDKVLNVSEDQKQPVSVLLGELLRTDENGRGIYQANITLNGGLESVVFLSSTSRPMSRTWWCWRAIVLEAPKGTATEKILRLRSKTDSILKSFNQRIGQSNTSLGARTNLHLGDRDADQLYLEIIFERLLHNTEQEAYDSLLRLYKPLLMDKATVKECSDKFADAIYCESLSAHFAQKLYDSFFAELANQDLTSAYIVLIDAPGNVDKVKLIDMLSSIQREQIRTMAQKSVDDYYNKMYNRTEKKIDPIVTRKKEIEKEQPPSDPCKRMIWELRIKPGMYVKGDNKTFYVVDFHCNSGFYKLAWIDLTKGRKGKLMFDSRIPLSTMDKYEVTSGGFRPCSYCNGLGYHLEYEWVQMLSGSNFYARTNKQTRVTCWHCSGNGH